MKFGTRLPNMKLNWNKNQPVTMRGSICNTYAGCRVKEKSKILFDQTKFCTRIHNANFGNGIKYRPGVMQGYICNICNVVNKHNTKLFEITKLNLLCEVAGCDIAQ